MTQGATVPFKLNIPAGLKDRLSEAAARSGRSLTSEIITRLEASISISDEGGLAFTLDSLERFVIGVVQGETEALAQRVRDLEARKDD
ncbi:Arc family DNA-binding protein [Paracoccus bogoriensis]|uniref:Arc family DNA-binding protein n=1 Tax=Paracoccus bogoriensis TaxID=242065 RepID=UPI001CA5765D|nr:Arc family DNA-binding protein [Paracoccus bogoriensis]MBW7057953.1 Arc family DNA-binding protein [Paracoccus bogoriensis]